MLALALFLCAQDAAPDAVAGDAGAADAGGALRILVVAKPGEREERVEDVYAGLRAAGLLPVDLEERAGVDRPAPPPSPKGTHDAARAALGTARAKFRDLDVDGARTAADSAVDEVLRMDRPEDALDVLDDALLLKASIALQAGLEDDARRSLVLVARLDPDRTELNAGLYPPSLVDAYAAARTAEQAAPPATLVVTPRVASFAPALVLVDGQPHKPASTALAAGPHLVIVRASGDVTAAKIVELDDKAPVVFAPFLAPPDAAKERVALTAEAARAVDEARQTKALASLAKLCAARAVLFVAGAHAALWSARGLQPLVVSSSASGAQLGLATLSALQAPVRAEDAGLDPVAIGALSGGVVIVAALIGVSLWALWPASPPKPPPPPVFFSCCVD